jgi:hypothetical protein
MFARTPLWLALLWPLLFAAHPRVHSQVLAPETIARIDAIIPTIRPDTQRFLDRRESRGLLYLYTFQEGQRNSTTDASADMTGNGIMGNMYIAPQHVTWQWDHAGLLSNGSNDGHRAFTMRDSKVITQHIFESREFTMEFIISIDRTAIDRIHPVAAFTHTMRPHLNFMVDEHGDPWTLSVIGQSLALPVHLTSLIQQGGTVITRRAWNGGGPDVVFTMVATDTFNNARVVLGHRLRMNFNEDTYIAIRFRDGTRPIMSISPQNGSNVVTHATFGNIFDPNPSRVFRFDREYWDRRSAPLKVGAQGRRNVLMPFMGTVDLLSMYNVFLTNAGIERNARFHPPALPFSNLAEMQADEYQQVALHPDVSESFQQIVYNTTLADAELLPDD